jgi:hypothetical protein
MKKSQIKRRKRTYLKDLLGCSSQNKNQDNRRGKRRRIKIK